MTQSNHRSGADFNSVLFLKCAVCGGMSPESVFTSKNGESVCSWHCLGRSELWKEFNRSVMDSLSKTIAALGGKWIK